MLEIGSPHRPALDNYDRRRYRRYKVALFGRYMLESRREYPCRTVDMSTDNLSLAAPVSGRVGEKVIAYIDEIGRIEGVIVRTSSGGFSLAIEATLRKRDKLAASLEWLAERGLSKDIDTRRGVRMAPRNPFAQLATPEGTHERCRIVDYSISGAALSLAARPAVGTPVALGRIGAKVVRHTEDGLAIAFNDLQDEAVLRELF